MVTSITFLSSHSCCIHDTKNFRNAYNLSQRVLEKLVKISFQKHTISGEEFLGFMLVTKMQPNIGLLKEEAHKFFNYQASQWTFKKTCGSILG